MTGSKPPRDGAGSPKSDSIDERRLGAGLDIAGIGLWERDLRTGKVIRTSMVDAIFGFGPGEAGDDAGPFLARIHSEDRNAMQRQIADAGGHGGPINQEFRVMRADGSVRWVWGQADLQRDADGSPVRLLSVLRDITDRKRMELALQESEARFRQLADTAPVLIWMSGPDKAGVYFNKTWLDFTGRPLEEELGAAWLQSVHPDDQKAIEACGEAFAARRPFRTEFRLRRHDGEWRWVLDTGIPRFTADGAFAGYIGSCIDITERKQSEERLRLLAAEVDHRSKNMLAVVLAMVRLTRATTVPTFVESFEGRIQALARAHTLLSEGRWEGADLRRLIEEELAPYRTADRLRARADGAAERLEPAAAQSVAMAVHELATNAAKYGALSVPQGRVAVTWSRRSDGGLTLRWAESGGPAVVAPMRQGLGTSVVERTIGQQLGGGAHFDWRPDGLVCELTMPAEQLARADTRN